MYRLEGLAHKVLQWYLCRMEGWFAADSETISLKGWDQVSSRINKVIIQNPKHLHLYFLSRLELETIFNLLVVDFTLIMF